MSKSQERAGIVNQPSGTVQPKIICRKRSGPEDFIPKEDYVGRDFARLEQQRLWPRTWQMACREEEIPRVGDYVTYDVLDESIIVVVDVVAFGKRVELNREGVEEGDADGTRSAVEDGGVGQERVAE